VRRLGAAFTGACNDLKQPENDRGEKHRRESCPEIAENNLAMATVAFDSHRTIFHSLAGTDMAPLRMMPASHSGYELTTVSRILDGHT
jgi:hypothetical protein